MYRLKVQQFTYLIGLPLLLVGWQNCSDVEFSQEALTSLDCTQLDVDGCGGQAPIEGESKTATFSQPAARSVDQKLDILVVTDTSGSMNAERSALAEGVKGFISDRFTDIRFAVLLAHVESNHSGMPYKRSGESILSTEQYDLSTSEGLEGFQSQVRDRLNNVAEEGVSDGGEAGLYSLYRSMLPNQYAEWRRLGFYRDDAALAVIFLSDENDICSYQHFPAGVQRVPDNQEVVAYFEHCADDQENRVISPSSILSELKAIKGDRPILMNGALYVDRTITPSSGENEVGYGYLELIGLANGIAEDTVHSSDQIKQHAVELAPEFSNENISQKITDGLSVIGQQVKEEIELRTRFTLHLRDNETYVPGSAVVKVDGVIVPNTTVTADEGTYVDVIIDRSVAGGALSNIQIDYQVGIAAGSEKPALAKLNQ
tara:strand:+ start:68853 stop:70139 length:1287 start_codon:yes stop_codon:yes gene_type:complete